MSFAAVLGAAAVVALGDAFVQARHRPILVSGLVDEPAHLITTLLVLVALGVPLRRDFVRAALVASVVIDVDHLPLILGSSLLEPGGTRPYPHTLLLPLILGAVGVMQTGRVRAITLGGSLGLVCHLARDVAEQGNGGPGAALWWPLSSDRVVAPYSWYAVGMGFLVAACVTRSLMRGRPPVVGA